ncbi:MAG: hypothetical protein AABY07_04105 [Nanoarchaeota archaeon]
MNNKAYYYEKLLEQFPKCDIEENIISYLENSIDMTKYRITIKHEDIIITGAGKTVKEAVQDILKLSRIIGLCHN